MRPSEPEAELVTGPVGQNQEFWSFKKNDYFILGYLPYDECGVSGVQQNDSVVNFFRFSFHYKICV